MALYCKLHSFFILFLQLVSKMGFFLSFIVQDDSILFKQTGQVSVWNIKPRNIHHHSYGTVKTSPISISEPSSALRLKGGGEVWTRNLNLKRTWCTKYSLKKMSKRKKVLRGIVVRRSAPSKKTGESNWNEVYFSLSRI